MQRAGKAKIGLCLWKKNSSQKLPEEMDDTLLRVTEEGYPEMKHRLYSRYFSTLK